MSIFVIADLHLSFKTPKPMNIFGDNWENHEEKIKSEWLNKVTDEDVVVLPGDFSWAMSLEDAYPDFKYLNDLPGHKLLLKGNHDYWWTTVTSMNKFLEENHFDRIYFLYNNSYCIEDKLIVGTRGWNLLDCEQERKMIKRESERLKLSIKSAIEEYGEDKEKIAFFHYPPITRNSIYQGEENEFVKILNEYGIKKCYYGHLHGNSHNEAILGEIGGITYNLISADYLDFGLVKI